MADDRTMYRAETFRGTLFHAMSKDRTRYYLGGLILGITACGKPGFVLSWRGVRSFEPTDGASCLKCASNIAGMWIGRRYHSGPEALVGREA